MARAVKEVKDALEKENPSLKCVLPKVFARPYLDPASLGGLIDLVSNIALGDAKARSTDGRWQYGTPPAGNANFAWLQHFAYHLSPAGQAGVVLAKGALTSKTSGEGDIRKALIEDGNLIDCIVNLPAKLFLNTQIPAALWFMSRGRGRDAINRVSTNRSGEILFILEKAVSAPQRRRVHRESKHYNSFTLSPNGCWDFLSNSMIFLCVLCVSVVN